MPIDTLQQYLAKKGVTYLRLQHSSAFTAQEVAAAAHVPGRELAKSVMVKLDYRLIMAVLPASQKIDFEMLKRGTGATHAVLAMESDFEDVFPDCDTGAMPPFGNLYGVPVYVARSLAEDEDIAFNACSHTELIRMPFADFARIVRPIVLEFSRQEELVM